MLQELKEFLFKGNAFDLAIGVILGGAFGAIVTSIVGDIIMPIIGAIFGNPDYSTLTVGPVLLGNFLNAFIAFLTIGLVLFMLVKAAKKFEKEAPPAPPPGPTAEEKLLIEIRDLLQK